MADSQIRVKPSNNPGDPPVAMDQVGSKYYQYIKIDVGDEGADDHVTQANPLPVGGALLGTIDETAPASDTASSGLNGRLQRLAQHLTTLLARIGITTETAPASDTADAGLNGRLQRVAQRITSLLTLAGSVNETAPASDTADSGLNGRLQRIAQRLTTIITTLTTTGISGKITDLSASSTVAIGSASGTIIDCRGYRATAITIPASFDGTTISFQGSTDGIVFATMRDRLNESITQYVLPGYTYPLWSEVGEFPYISIQCGTVQATTTTVFTVALRSN